LQRKIIIGRIAPGDNDRRRESRSNSATRTK